MVFRFHVAHTMLHKAKTIKKKDKIVHDQHIPSAKTSPNVEECLSLSPDRHSRNARLHRQTVICTGLCYRLWQAEPGRNQNLSKHMFCGTKEVVFSPTLAAYRSK